MTAVMEHQSERKTSLFPANWLIAPANAPGQIIEHQGKNRHERRQEASKKRGAVTAAPTNDTYRKCFYCIDRHGEAAAINVDFFPVFARNNAPLVKITRREFKRRIA